MILVFGTNTHCRKDPASIQRSIHALPTIQLETSSHPGIIAAHGQTYNKSYRCIRDEPFPLAECGYPRHRMHQADNYRCDRSSNMRKCAPALELQITNAAPKQFLSTARGCGFKSCACLSPTLRQPVRTALRRVYPLIQSLSTRQCRPAVRSRRSGNVDPCSSQLLLRTFLR